MSFIIKLDNGKELNIANNELGFLLGVEEEYSNEKNIQKLNSIYEKHLLEIKDYTNAKTINEYLENHTENELLNLLYEVAYWDVYICAPELAYIKQKYHWSKPKSDFPI